MCVSVFPQCVLMIFIALNLISGSVLSESSFYYPVRAKRAQGVE